MNTVLRILSILMASVVSSSSCFAVIVYSNAAGTNGTYTVSSTDLANSGQPTFGSITLLSGASADFDGSSISNLVDGTMYGTLGFGDTGETFTPANGAQVVITFDTLVNTAGYNLSTINVYTGSGSGQLRFDQKYTVAWAAPGSGSYSDLISVNSSAGNSELWTSIYNNAGGSIATGVGSLRFTFYDTVSSEPQSMYREIDVVGAAAAVPEPASVGAVLGSAALGLIAWRRRRGVRVSPSR